MTKRQTMTKEQAEELNQLVQKYADLPKNKQDLMKEAALMASPLGDTINKLEKLAHEMARIIAKHAQAKDSISPDDALGTIGAVGVVLIDVRDQLIKETVQYVEFITSQMFEQLTGQVLPTERDKNNLQKAIDLLSKASLPEDNQKKTPPSPLSEEKETKTVH